jgi:DNA-binding NtrC family response regulator
MEEKIQLTVVALVAIGGLALFWYIVRTAARRHAELLQAIQQQGDRIMGTQPNTPPVTLADVKKAVVDLGTDLTAVVVDETGQIATAVTALKDRLDQNGTPVTSQDLADLLTGITTVKTNLTTKIQDISKLSGADDANATKPPAGGGTEEPKP